jgi:hypothetical protein
MNDAQRYRMNAAEYLSAAERCEPAYRDLTFALAEAWLSLARQQEAMDGLLAICSKATSATSTVSSPVIRKVESLVDGHDVEILEGDRLVGRLKSVASYPANQGRRPMPSSADAG